MVCPERNPSPLTLAFMLIRAQKVERAEFSTPKCDKTENITFFGANKGENSEQSPDSSHRFALNKQHYRVSWIITFSLEEVEPNLNPAPRRRHNTLKEGDGGTRGTPSIQTITSCYPLPQKAPPCPAELPHSPLLTARQKGLHEPSNNPKQRP